MSCFYGPRLTQLINSKGFHLSWESPMQTPSVTSTGELVMTIIGYQQSSSSSWKSSWISSHMYISMTSNTILPNSHFSVNYDFEEPEFDNITNEAKVSSLSLALNTLSSLSSASWSAWLSSPSSSQRSSSSSRSGFHLLSSDSATSSASDCCRQLATWLATGWWWSSWWSQW